MTSNALHYLSRTPERLVLEGYRYWTRAVATASPVPMDEANAFYRGLLGDQLAKPAFTAMADFVHTLGLCAKCPLHMFATNTPNICSDEVLILGLIAGIQNSDDEAAELCLNTLSCASRCEEVAMAAGSFALILRGANRTLIPISAELIRTVLRSRNENASSASTTVGKTLH